MKILLVQPYAGAPPDFLTKLSTRLPVYPNLTLQQLAGICSTRDDIKVVDENRGNTIRFDHHYDVVCISCRTATASRTYEIADEFRKQKIPVILGGYHATALPEEAKHHADSVILGEAEISLPLALNDLQKQELKPFYSSQPVDPKLIPPARRDVIDYFLPIAAIEATRGCPIRCDFCFVEKVKGSSYRKRPIENVIEELKSIRQKRLLFYDSSLTIDPAYTKSLFKNMTGLNKHFSCYGNINVLGKDDELLNAASDAGCIGWCIGFESISQNIIDSIGKTTNKVEEYISAVKKIKDYNMNVTGSFIFGFDDHISQSFSDTLNMIKKLEISLACVNILTPFPGSLLFEKIKKEGRILTFDWSRYSMTEPIFQPLNMTGQELYKGTIWVLDEYYTFIPTLKRILDSARYGFHPCMDTLLGNVLYLARKYDTERNYI
ncbi:MAG: radical SAM protein [Candidatus Thermoplasmatota archaeon]|jgi:radical SAM superfamily enzyme YgiQ (UPF0313 family)|nr:radical SAM protein [Candidatus Thermoplasmatota archaeon]